jgi:hypothetical protein
MGRKRRKYLGWDAAVAHGEAGRSARKQLMKKDPILGCIIRLFILLLPFLLLIALIEKGCGIQIIPKQQQTQN